MAVSRSPVREALRQLQQEGLVDVYPYQGAIVAGVPNDEVPLIYGLRAAIEAEAFALACRVATSADFDRLTDLWYEMEQAMRRTGTLRGVMEADLAFHAYVVNLVSSPFVRSMAASLDRVVRATVVRVNAADRPEFDERGERDTASHLPLLDALRSRDADRARRLAYEHVDLPWTLPPTGGTRRSGRRGRSAPPAAGRPLTPRSIDARAPRCRVRSPRARTGRGADP